MENLTSIDKSFKDLEELRDSLQGFDKETLIDTLTYILKIYVLDKQTVNESAIPNSQNTFNNFYECINSLKTQNRFPEMDLFSIHDGKVFVSVNGKSYELFVPVSEEPKGDSKETISECESESLIRFSNLEI